MSDVFRRFAAPVLRWLPSLWRREKKQWCVIFYLVSKAPGSGVRLPEESLDEKLDAVVQTVKSIPKEWLRKGVAGRENVHLVYRAVWEDSGRPAVAEVVSPLPWAPMMTIQ